MELLGSLAILYLPLLWLAIAITCGSVASARGYSGFGWFLIGLLFGPLGLAVGFMPTLIRERKDCPLCGEIVWKYALVCRCCGHQFEIEANKAGLTPDQIAALGEVSPTKLRALAGRTAAALADARTRGDAAGIDSLKSQLDILNGKSARSSRDVRAAISAAEESIEAPK